VALRVKVSLGIERADASSSERATLERTATELDLAIGELRDLARGLLVSSGATAVAPALRNVTRHWPMAVHVRERNVNAFDPKVEAAVYGCVLEALQHARAQRAPAAKSSAVVSLVGVPDAIHFVVRGRGTAFDLGRATAHDSAEHIADRAHAAGGSLSFEALPGRGLLMRGSIPLTGGL
jgi:signal transduction histidine kinase